MDILNNCFSSVIVHYNEGMVVKVKSFIVYHLISKPDEIHTKYVIKQISLSLKPDQQ